MSGNNLVAFLRARLEEDRKTAFEAGNGGPGTWIYDPELPWNSDAGPREAVVRFTGSALGYVAAVDPVHGKYGTWDAQHIARHDPARVLAEVDAKQRIIAQYEEVCGTVKHPPSAEARRAARVGQFELEQVLQALALPYRDHPDYRKEWCQ